MTTPNLSISLRRIVSITLLLIGLSGIVVMEIMPTRPTVSPLRAMLTDMWETMRTPSAPKVPITRPQAPQSTDGLDANVDAGPATPPQEPMAEVVASYNFFLTPPPEAPDAVLDEFDQQIAPGGWNLGWETFANPLPLGNQTLIIFERKYRHAETPRGRTTPEDYEAVIRLVDWKDREINSQKLAVLDKKLGSKRWIAVAGKEGIWLLGPHLVLIRDVGQDVLEPVNWIQPTVAVSPQGGIFVLARNPKQGGLELTRVSVNPNTYRFKIEPLGPVPKSQRDGAMMTVLNDGRVVVAGGRQSTGAVDVYNPRNGQWEEGSRLPEERGSGVALALPDGRVVFAGTSILTGGAAHKVQLWDPKANHWQTLPQTPLALQVTNRQEQGRISAAVLPNGGLVIAGGMDAAVQVLDRQGDGWASHWRVVPSGSTPRPGGVVQALSDGRVALAGGIHSESWRPECCTKDGIDLIRLDEPMFRNTLGLQRLGPTLAVHRNDLLVIGGSQKIGDESFSETSLQASALVERMNLISGSVRQSASAPSPSFRARAVWIDADRLLAKALSSPMAIYDARAETWRPIQNGLVQDAALMGVGNNKALLCDADGSCSTVALDTEEAQDFKRLTLARAQSVGRVLADGRIVVAGGYAADKMVSVIDPDCDHEGCPERFVGMGPPRFAGRHEIYSPDTQRWQLSLPTSAQATQEVDTVILADGRVVHRDANRLQQSSVDGQSWSDMPWPGVVSGRPTHEKALCDNNKGMNSCRLVLGQSPDGRDLLIFRHVGQYNRHWLWDDARSNWHYLDGPSGSEPLAWIEFVGSNGHPWRVMGMDQGFALVWQPPLAQEVVGNAAEAPRSSLN